MEQWKDVPGFEGLYHVSNLGNVISLQHKSGFYKLALFKDRYGYLCVNLYKDGKVSQPKVHRLVASAFLGKSHLAVDHIDHNKTNNNVSNLRYVTNAQNSAHYFNEKRGGKSSQYTGVYFHANKNKWGAEIRQNGKAKYLGLFKTEEEAYKARLLHMAIYV